MPAIDIQLMTMQSSLQRQLREARAGAAEAAARMLAIPIRTGRPQ